MIVAGSLRLLYLLLPPVLRLVLLGGRTPPRRTSKCSCWDTRSRAPPDQPCVGAPWALLGRRCRGAAPAHSPRKGEDRSPTDGQDRGRRASRTKGLPGRVGGSS